MADIIRNIIIFIVGSSVGSITIILISYGRKCIALFIREEELNDNNSGIVYKNERLIEKLKNKNKKVV